MDDKNREQNNKIENSWQNGKEVNQEEASIGLDKKGGSNSKKLARHDRMKIWFYAAAGILLIAVIVVLIVVNFSDKEGGTDNTEISDSETVIIEESDELTSGSVTTTIGGKSITYKAAYVVDGVAATIKSGTYESTSDDEAVFLVINGGSLAIEGGVTINKTGSADFDGRGDDYSFYGINSAVVVVGEGSSVAIVDATINTSVDGANAIVATNSGSAVVGNIVINTTADSSRGLHATYGGTIVGNDVKISTQGQSCAALATDRGSGTVKVSGAELLTAGAGSPLIYSTGEIEVSSSTGVATGAQIAVVEGKNSITLNDCDFSANGVGNRGSVDNAGVMIYQSMSGDASVGTGSFMATDCTLTVLSDSSVYMKTPFFFVTNTEAEISLSTVTANFYEGSYFLSAVGTDEWGKSGANGATVTIDASNLTATNTNLNVDEISSVKGL